MEKKIITIVFIAIGLTLSFLLRWYQVHRGTEQAMREIMMDAQRLDMIAALAMAQEHFQKDVVRDENKDRIGEFGTMADLYSTRPSKGSCIGSVLKKYFSPHGYDLAQCAMTDDGRLLWQGYVYSIFFPDAATERQRNWCVFAHPLNYSEPDACKTYFLEARAPARFYFTVYDGYSGLKNGPNLEDVYEGKPFDGRIRELDVSLSEGEPDEEKVQAAVAKVRQSKGKLWISLPLVYPKGYCPPGAPS